MPPVPTSHLVRNTILIFLVVGIVGGVIFFAVQKETPTVPLPPVTPPETPTETVVEEKKAPEPAKVPESVQSQIDAIALQLDKGEITREEAQKQVNQILGITP
jgi:hypothetical protein